MSIKSVYFFIAEHVKGHDDSIIYFAEGLKELGLDFYANRNFWQVDTLGNYLFTTCPDIKYQDCDLVVFSYSWFEYMDPEDFTVTSKEFPDFIFEKKRNYKTIYLDPTDGYKTRSWDEKFRQFDLIFRAKYNRFTHNPHNLRAWVLGYSSRMLNANEHVEKIKNRDYIVLENFNFSHPYEHGLRKLAKEEILPLINRKVPVVSKSSPKGIDLQGYDLLMWEQTDHKHNPKYYEMLNQSYAIAAFCGEMIPYYPLDPSIYLVGGKKSMLKKKAYSIISKIAGKKNRIIQWDSWRFWESLCAACIPIHVDLEKYGVELPIMPNNWQHYIGIDLDNLNRDIERIAQDPSVKSIGLQGRKWMIENYSPKTSAQRILDYL